MATSAYQVEGGTDLDGRGPSIWDVFARRPGAVRSGADGRVAADHRRRMAADVALVAGMGVGAYRFSVAWPRVQPSGRGAVNERGLDFYRSLVDALLASGVEPVVTLYHWDLPQALEEEGGWPARTTALRFAEYAAAVGRALGDRVRRWVTVNEPWCVAMLGYGSGVHAPGRADPAAAVAAAHHVLLGHGLAVDALRASVGADAEIAISLNPYPVVVAGGEEADADAARRVDGVANRLWYDALLEGRYPEDVLEDFAAVSDLAHVRDGDLRQIARPLDALGLNYYRRHHVRARPAASATPPRSAWPGSRDIELVQPVGPVTDGGWAIEPAGLREALQAVVDGWSPPPLYLHEIGAAFDDDDDDDADDGPGEDGLVHDEARVAYLDAHVRAAADAVADGVDLRGLFVWSLLDNFEWAEGYAHRFGIVHVDFATQHRTPKTSARWYAELIARGGRLTPPPRDSR